MIKGQPRGDRSYVQFIGNAMGQVLTPPLRTLDVEVAVSVEADRTFPNPAISATPDLGLETRSHILRRWPHHYRQNHTTDYTEWIGKQLLGVLEVPA